MKTEQLIPPDVAAYLVLAAVNVAKEQTFQPANEADCERWMHDNIKAIAEEASAMQWNLLDRMENGFRGGKESLMHILRGRVWLECNRRNIIEREREFLNYENNRHTEP